MRFLDEDMDYDNLHADCRNVNGSRNASLAFEAHLPERAAKVFKVWLADSFQSVGLNEFYNSLIAGSEVDG